MNNKNVNKKNSSKDIKITVTSNKLSEQGLKNLSFAMYKFEEEMDLNKYN